MRPVLSVVALRTYATIHAAGTLAAIVVTETDR
jgi:hypothetical protein